MSKCVFLYDELERSASQYFDDSGKLTSDPKYDYTVVGEQYQRVFKDYYGVELDNPISNDRLDLSEFKRVEEGLRKAAMEKTGGFEFFKPITISEGVNIIITPQSLLNAFVHKNTHAKFVVVGKDGDAISSKEISAQEVVDNNTNEDLKKLLEFIKTAEVSEISALSFHVGNKIKNSNNFVKAYTLDAPTLGETDKERLDSITEQYGEEHHKIVNKFLDDLFENSKTFVDYKVSHGTYAGAAGFATNSEVVVQLGIGATAYTDRSYKAVAETYVHEKTHVATTTLYDTNKAFKRKIDRLYDRALREVNGDKTAYYGLTNAYEFMAETMTDATFQEFLNTIPGKKTTLLDDFFNYLFDAISKVVPGFRTDSLLAESMTFLIEEMASQTSAGKSINALQLVDAAVFDSISDSGLIDTRSGPIDDEHLRRFATKYGLDVFSIAPGINRLGLTGSKIAAQSWGMLNSFKDKKFNKLEIHSYITARGVKGTFSHLELVDIISPNTLASRPNVKFKVRDNTDQIGDLQDITDSIGESIQKPSNENGGFYFIDNKPHWRATSYLGFSADSIDPVLAMNSTRVGNIVDEIGKRVFRGDEINTITHKDILDFVQAEDTEYTWTRQPISKEQFALVVGAMVDAKEELKRVHGFTSFHSDVIFWDKNKLVAGEADIVGVKPDGSKTVIDLKTRRTGLVNYDVRFKGKQWSDREKHTKQTNLYSDMAADHFFEKYNAPLIIMMSPQYSDTYEVEESNFNAVEGDSLYSIIELERRSDFFDFSAGGNRKESKAIREYVNDNRAEYKAWYANQMKVDNPGLFKENVEKQVNILQEKLEQLNETLVQYLNISKGAKTTNIVKLEKLSSELKDKLDRELDNVTIEEQLAIVLDFFDFSLTEVEKMGQELSADLINEDIESEIDQYHKAMKYRGVFDLARELYEDIEQISQFLPDASEFQDIRESYKTLQGAIAEADAKIQSKLTSLTSSLLKNSYLGSVAEIKYRNNFYKEGKVAALKENPNASKKEVKAFAEEYVNEKLRSPEVEQLLMEEYHREIDELINTTSDDMLTSSMYLFSDATINNTYVKLMHTMLVKAKQNFSEKVNMEFIAINDLYKELKLTKAEIKDLMSPDKDGNFLLKNKYKFEYVEEITALRAEMRELKDNEKTTPADIQAKINEIKAWYAANTTLVDNTTQPSDKWLNPEFNKLNARQKKAIEYFESISEKNDISRIGAMSLGRTESNNVWYRVPGVLATSFEHATRANFLASVKKAFNAATTVEKDDTDMGDGTTMTDAHGNIKYVYTALDGSPIKSVPIYFRNRLGDKQSTDLFSVYAMEAANGIRYYSDSDSARKGQLLKDFVDTKQFNKTEGFAKRKTMSIFRGKDSKVADTIAGEASVVSKQLTKMLDNQVYSILHEYAGSVKIGGKEFDINRVAGFISSYTAMANMGFKVLGAANNWATGNVALAVEAAGGEFITPKDLTRAKQVYASNIMAIAGDIGKPVQTSFVNQLLRFFDAQSEMGALDNRFERTNIGTQLLKTDSAMALYSMGEHEIHATMMLSLLSSQKMLNSKGKYLDANGKVVATKDEAASMLDIFYLKEDGVLDIVEWAKGDVYNTHETVEDLQTGGLGKMRLLIKDRIIRTQGAYGKDTQSAMDRFWYGKLFKQFKKHIAPQTMNRFRGLNYVGKQSSEIPEERKYYNYTTKTDEHGYYVSFLRHLLHMIKVGKYNILSYKKISSDNWGELTVHEQANIRKTMTELSYIMSMVVLAGLAAGAAADDDDNWLLYSSAYLMRRQMSDAGLAYYDPSEAWRLTDSPMAAIRQLNTIRDAITYIAPWNWDETYESGYNKGKNKTLTKLKKAALLDRMVQFDEGFMKRKYTSLDSH